LGASRSSLLDHGDKAALASGAGKIIDR